MHAGAMIRMKWFVENYVKDGDDVRLLDVGSYDVNGCFRGLFDKNKLTYIGLDMSDGPNVDYVPDDPYSWDELEDESFDYIISANAFEHIEYPWVTICEIYKKLKNKGFACIHAPNSILEHRYPTDCYRYFSDGFTALAKWAGFQIVDVTVGGVPSEKPDRDWFIDEMNDTLMVVTKGYEENELVNLPRLPYEIRTKTAAQWHIRYEFLLRYITRVDKKEQFINFLKEHRKDRIYIYGCGPIGKLVYGLLENIGCELIFIDRDGTNTPDYKCLSIKDDIDESDNSCMIISILDGDAELKEELTLRYTKIDKWYCTEILR